MWHGKLLKSVVPVSYYAGNYRSAARQHPCLNVDVQVGNVFGSPFQEVPDRMADFSRTLESATVDTDHFIEEQQSVDLKLKAAAQIASLAAGSVIQIHPFRNGNGRIARFTANFFFDRYGFKMPFYIQRPSGADYGAASAAVMLGDFVPLYQYFVTLMAM